MSQNELDEIKNLGVGFLLSKAGRWSTKLYQKALQEHHLSSLTPLQVGVLMLTSKKPIKNKDIAKALVLDKVTLQPILARLLELNLISQKVSEKDARVRNNEATEQGKSLLKTIVLVDQSVNQSIQKNLSKKEWEALQNILVPLYQKFTQ